KSGIRRVCRNRAENRQSGIDQGKKGQTRFGRDKAGRCSDKTRCQTGAPPHDGKGGEGLTHG
ncbi:MAG: hypothetical protein KKH72_15055, partial [Alphaproteobacteria bacterium]|nr:hypothetical protein [Alphaproteobacteria bacterium]